MDLPVRGRIVQQSIEAVITRADGTVENLGVVAYWHENPLHRMAHRLRRKALTVGKRISAAAGAARAMLTGA